MTSQAYPKQEGLAILAAMKATDMLQQIHEKIPLTQAMGLNVLVCSADELSLAAEFSKNKNHKGTVFGGSLSTVLTLAAWAWLTNYLDEELSYSGEISIQKGEVEYIKPVTEDFVARCFGASSADLKSFKTTLQRRGRARLKLESKVLGEGGEVLVSFTGHYVAHP